MNDIVDDLVALHRQFSMLERDAVCCGDVTVQQCVVLQTLLTGPIEVGALAESVSSSPSAMTRLLDGMSKHGWIKRQRDSDDRRIVRVDLTKKGRSEADRLRKLTEESISMVINALPADKRAQVVDSIGLLRRALEASRVAVGVCC